MICSRCEKNEATVFFKQLIDNKVTETRICLECAQAENMPAQSPASPLFDLLAALSGGKARLARRKSVQCPICGLRETEFRRAGRLGCPRCYETYCATLTEALKKMHGALRHTGKSPPHARKAAAAQARTAELARLRSALKKAVTAESFEDAARVRDRIKTLESD